MTSIEIVPVVWLMTTTVFSFIGQGTVFSFLAFLFWKRFFKKEQEVLDSRDIQIELLRERVQELTASNKKLEDANGRIITMTIDRLTREQ